MAKSNHFLKSRNGLVITGIVALTLAWLVWLRASDTGSLQQYGILIILVFFGINRLVTAVTKR
jgi:hypothetical protein